MLKVVLDTNVLVSALWTPAGNASTIVNLIFSDNLIPCFDQNILDEYKAVLSRPRLTFSQDKVNKLINEITSRGLSATVMPSKIQLPDETDRKFYDVAKFFKAYLITGNTKHFPNASFITNPAGFLKIYKTYLKKV